MNSNVASMSKNSTPLNPLRYIIQPKHDQLMVDSFKPKIKSDFLYLVYLSLFPSFTCQLISFTFLCDLAIFSILDSFYVLFVIQLLAVPIPPASTNKEMQELQHILTKPHFKVENWKSPLSLLYVIQGGIFKMTIQWVTISLTSFFS